MSNLRAEAPSEVLLIEDNQAYAKMLATGLARVGTITVRLTHAASLAEGLQRLSDRQFDLILLDLNLPDSTGIDTLTRIKAVTVGMPVVVLTGTEDQAVAAQAMNSGAQDYLVKGHSDLDVLARAIRYAVHARRAEKEIQHLASFPQLNPDPILEVDSTGAITFCNAATVEQLKSLGIDDDPRLFLPSDMGQILQAMNLDMPEERRRLQRQVTIGKRIFAAEVHLMPRHKSARVYTRDVTDRHEAEAEIRTNIEKLSRMMEGIVNALASASELRDPYTAGHQKRVSQLACALADEIGLTGDQLESVRVAATLHDIGKMYVPAEILTKPGRLAPVEMSIIKVHPEAGSNILKPIDFPWPVAQIVHQHHERMDGTGYPKGITGEAIMKEARIIAVADVVEAMASHRPYRPALGVERAISEIKNAKTGIYDPEVVAACLMLFNARGFEFK